MKLFHCDHCGNVVFFENTTCLSCNAKLAYLPDLAVVGSLDDAADGMWKTPIPRAEDKSWWMCENYTKHDVCNWGIPSNETDPFCMACRLTRTYPDLERPNHKMWWYKLEVAKRRVVVSLLALGLPVEPKGKPKDGDEEADDGGLAFEFLADPEDPNLPRVLTGHANGVITINVAEADDAEREKRRVMLKEPYRTLLGHVRHELGHYYWDRLVRDDEARLAACRELFGDDRLDYGEALKRNYEQGPAPDWPSRFVSSYASVHPWEDWAETWAHYLHMTDTLESAAACGLSLRPRRRDIPTLKSVPDPKDIRPETFDALIDSWYSVTYAMNHLNRGMGLPDAYPFVLSPPAVEKLRFVHETVAAAKAGQTKCDKRGEDSGSVIRKAVRWLLGGGHATATVPVPETPVEEPASVAKPSPEKAAV